MLLSSLLLLLPHRMDSDANLLLDATSVGWNELGGTTTAGGADSMLRLLLLASISGGSGGTGSGGARTGMGLAAAANISLLLLPLLLANSSM